MALTKNRSFSRLATNVNDDGDINSNGIASTVSLGADVYDSIGELPYSGNSLGDQAFVNATNRLYIWAGTGWYNVALINRAPTIVSIQDSDGNTSPFYLSKSGEASTITITAADSDDSLVTYSYVADSNTSRLATISQDSSVLTITPYSEDSATANTSTVTVKATDGVNISSAAIILNLTFQPGTLTLPDTSEYVWTSSTEAGAFNTSGEYLFIPDEDVTVRVHMWGATGGGLYGGWGGFVKGDIAMTAGTSYYFRIGGGGIGGNFSTSGANGGYNNGSNPAVYGIVGRTNNAAVNVSSGAGWTGITEGAVSSSNMLLLAGGGGGSAGSSSSSYGGFGGYPNGTASYISGQPSDRHGQGGTQSAGGARGVDGLPQYANGSTAGGLLYGGKGASSTSQNYSGGGGGAGWYGGGGGGGNNHHGPGGGGGSSYYNSSKVTNFAYENATDLSHRPGDDDAYYDGSVHTNTAADASGRVSPNGRIALEFL